MIVVVVVVALALVTASWIRSKLKLIRKGKCLTGPPFWVRLVLTGILVDVWSQVGCSLVEEEEYEDISSSIGGW
jgi:hypothetical protein